MLTYPAVTNTSLSDLPQIFEFFEASILYQERNGYPSWRNYDRSAVERDVIEGHQYKVVFGSQIGLVFSVAYRDPIIWRERDRSDALYLHRIVVNPMFKGQRLFSHLLDWAILHAEQKKLMNIRMDTWALNPTIIKYYESFGFKQIENFVTPDTTELPVHNRKLALTLLEFQRPVK